MGNEEIKKDPDLEKSIRDLNSEGFLNDSDQESPGAIRVTPSREVEGLSDEARIARVEAIEQTTDVGTWFKYHKVVVATQEELNANLEGLGSDEKNQQKITEALGEYLKPKTFWVVMGRTRSRFGNDGRESGHEILFRCIDRDKNLVEVKVATDMIASLKNARTDSYPDSEQAIRNISKELEALGFDFIDDRSERSDIFIQLMRQLLIKVRRKEEEKTKEQNAKDFEF